CLRQAHGVSLRALHLRLQRRVTAVAVHEIQSFGITLQLETELDQADQYREELAAKSSQHVFVPNALPGRLVWLLSQNSRIDHLLESRRRDLFSDTSSLREVFKTCCAPECFTEDYQRRTRPDSFEGALDRTEIAVARSIAVS